METGGRCFERERVEEQHTSYEVQYFIHLLCYEQVRCISVV